MIGRHLQLGLQGSGYPPTWCRTAGSGLIQVRETGSEIVRLDPGLPDGDAIDPVRAFRTGRADTVLIILTVRSNEIDIIVGFDAGADDNLVTPVSLTVLLARLRGDENWYGPTKTLDVTMAALRGQLSAASRRTGTAARLPVIITLRSHGYRLDAPPGPDPERYS